MVHTLSSWIYDIKKYHKFSAEELRGMLIGILITAFIISFDNWGVDKFDLLYGLRNLTNAVIIVGVSMFIHNSVQRITALNTGFSVEYRPWIYGLVLGLVVAIVSNGKLWFLAPGGIIVYHMEGHRIGGFRFGLNFWPVAITAIMGPVANIVLAILFKILTVWFPANMLLQQALSFNIWYAIITMLPIPPLDGSHMFFISRLFYVFLYAAIIGFSISLLFLGIWLSLLFGLVLGVIMWQAQFWIVEQ